MLKKPLCSLEASNLLSIETTIRRDVKICRPCNKVKLKYLQKISICLFAKNSIEFNRT